MKKYPNKIVLPHDQIVKICNIMRDTFAENCDENVITLTSILQAKLTTISDRFINENAFYDTLDNYIDLRETYQTLTYHHELYRKGKTRKKMFLRVCGSMYFEAEED